ncbi:MAG: hypothetical protein PVJ61_02965 [Dehalococcoidia bacterium]|jgi:hypothetical protein
MTWLRILFGIFLILHGVVHWVYALPQRQEYEPNSKPWAVFTGRWLVKKAGVHHRVALRLGVSLLILITLAFIASGVAVLTMNSWWALPAIASAGISTLFLALFWNRWMVQGVLVNTIIIIMALFWTP